MLCLGQFSRPSSQIPPLYLRRDFSREELAIEVEGPVELDKTLHNRHAPNSGATVLFVNSAKPITKYEQGNGLSRYFSGDK